jgi:phosphopantetheinyl transferase
MSDSHLVVVVAPVVGAELSSLPVCFKELLSNEDLIRANGIHDKNKQLEFVSGRALLRGVLSTFVNGSPDRLAIQVGSGGRPYLHGSSLDFSLSHAAGYVCLAVSKTNKVGADIEDLSTVGGSRELTGFLQRILVNHERQISDVTNFDLVQYWCVCEAYAKCSGRDVLSIIRSSKFREFVSDSLSTGWSIGSRYSVFRTAFANGNVPLAICIDSKPVSFEIIEVDLLDANFRQGFK